MDRSMKVMFGMMTIAICLLAFTMMGKQSQQAYAGEYVGGGDRGTEPTIVSFRVVKYTNNNDYQYSDHFGYRMWSNGAVEINYFGTYFRDDWGSFDQDFQQKFPDGWILITDSVAGYACVGDVDGNRSVDPNDLMAVLKNWGQCEQDPPLGLPDDDDLM